jgi:sporulation protein YlmC with PRC-barrel domain
MYKRISIIALAIVLTAGPFAMADTPLEASKYTDPGPNPPSTSIKVGDYPRRISQYMNGREVYNQEGKQIGTIKDIVLDGPANAISYAVLSYTGSAKLFAVPWAAFQRKLDDTEKLYLVMSDDVLKNAPGFTQDNWPDTGNAEFRTQVNTYYKTYITNTDGHRETVTVERTQTTVAPVDKEGKQLPAKSGPVKDGLVWSRRASAVIGAKVVNKQDEDLGVIKDVVFNPRTGVIQYAALSYGGFLGKGDKLFAVPVRAFESKPDQKVFCLDVSKEYLKNAPSFDKEKWPKWEEETLRVRLDEFYRVTNTPPVAKP